MLIKESCFFADYDVIENDLIKLNDKIKSITVCTVTVHV